MENKLEFIDRKYNKKISRLVKYLLIGAMTQCGIGIGSTIFVGIRNYINPFKNNANVINYHEANDSLMELSIEKKYYRPRFSYEPNHIKPHIEKAYNLKKQKLLEQVISLTKKDIEKMKKINSVKGYHKWNKNTQKFNYLTGICVLSLPLYFPIYWIGKGIISKQKEKEIERLEN